MKNFICDQSVAVYFQSKAGDARFPAVPGYTFVLQLSGYRKVTVDGSEQTLRPADFMVIRPGLAFAFRDVENMPQKSALLYVPETDIQQLLQSSDQSPLAPFLSGNAPVRLVADACFSLESDLLALAQELKAAPELAEITARLRAQLIVVQALRSRHTEDARAQLRRRSTMDQVVAFINANFSSDITLNGMAQLFETTSSALSRSFKKYTGMQPIAYLNQVRIRAAKELILRTEMPLSYICSQVGYESQTYFGRVFKASTGMTPSQFRREERHRAHHA